jgi:hypothetical protein
MASGGSGGGGSTSIAREVSATAAMPEKVAETTTVEEVTTTKMAEEATTAKVIADKAMADKVDADKAAMTKVAEEAVAKAVTDAVAMETAGVGLGGGLSQRGPLRDWWGPDSAPLLAWWRDLRGWLHSSFQVVPQRLETPIRRAAV